MIFDSRKKMPCSVSRNPFWDSKPELFSDIACLRKGLGQ